MAIKCKKGQAFGLEWEVNGHCVEESEHQNGKMIDCRTQFDLNHPLWPPLSRDSLFGELCRVLLEVWRKSFAEGRFRTVGCRPQFDLHYPL